MDFIVTGLPRSGTTWLANWLTTNDSLCLHDPFSMGFPDQWPRDGRRFGISCTGVYLMPEFLALQHCPVAIIERDPAQCEASLRNMGMDGSTRALRDALAKTDGRRFRFDDIWDEDKARDLWDFLLPGLPVDALRYRLLSQMQVQPHMGKWSPNQDVIREVSAKLRSN